MRIQFTKLIQFSLLVKAGDRLREFNFRKLLSDDSQLILAVNVCDERGNRIFFTMERSDKDWKIISLNSLPVWVEQGQPALSIAIDEELKIW